MLLDLMVLSLGTVSAILAGAALVICLAGTRDPEVLSFIGTTAGPPTEPGSQTPNFNAPR